MKCINNNKDCNAWSSAHICDDCVEHYGPNPPYLVSDGSEDFCILNTTLVLSVIIISIIGLLLIIYKNGI